MHTLPSPSFKAIAAMLKAFQSALLPSSGSLTSPVTKGPIPSPHANFRFALGSSAHPTLSRAIVECVQQVIASYIAQSANCPN